MPAKTKKSPAAAAPAEKPIIAAPSSQQIGVTHSNIDQTQVLKAFRALSAHIARRTASSSDSSSLPLDGPSGNLRDPSNAVYLQLTISHLNPVSKVKPVRINLPHPLHTPGEPSVCLLVKDPQREYKDLLTSEKIKCISRVVGVTKLKGKFKPFDARRALVQENDIFLADSRIVPTLPNLCGKVFFDAKKNPITVDITKKGEALRKELEGAVQGTVWTQNKGSCSTVKVGYMQKHSPEELTENLMAALPAVLGRIKGGWENVHNLDVKTGNSAALPVWNRKLGVKTHVTPSAETAKVPSKVSAEEEAKAAKSVKSTPAKAVKGVEAAKVETPKANASVQKAKRVAQEEETPSKKKQAPTPVASPAVKKIQEEAKETPKKPSPRKTRAAAAKANGIAESAASTPVKAVSAGTPRKVASSVTRSVRKTK